MHIRHRPIYIPCLHQPPSDETILSSSSTTTFITSSPSSPQQPASSPSGDVANGQPCGHILYVLHYVLACPEPLRWQQAFLLKELQAIFRYSTAFEYTKSIARESAYVREHADRELKRLAKKSKRPEKKARALARRQNNSLT